MKKLKYITVIILIVGGGLVSCSEVLDVEPQAAVTASNAYNTPDDAARALTSAYEILQANNWCCTPAGNGHMYWVFQNVATDDAEKGGEAGADQVYAQRISHYTLIPGNRTTVDSWTSQYVGIRRANAVLENLDGIEMDPNLKERYYAEAKFLRGYYYFNLLQTFGGVPLVLSTEPETYEIPRSSREETANQILSDFQDAAAVLPPRSGYGPEDYGRATKGAAQAYIGKVHIFLSEFSEAETAFQNVIDSNEYSLDPDYANMFTKAGETSPEIIFSVQHINQPPDQQQNSMGVVQGSRAMYGWGFNAPTQDFVDAFEEGDPRLKHTTYTNGDEMRDGKIADVGNSPTGYLNKKEYVADYEAPNGFFGSANDLILMRLGKVLLWYAEASNENGKTQQALDALNLVRERAREGNDAILPPITETNQNALREIIWHEQRVEYGQEYERFFDLVRTGRAGEVLRGYAEKYNTSKGAGFTDGVHELMPIPPSEVDLSKGVITQNPGY